MSDTIDKPLKILGHDCYVDPKDQRRSFSVDAAYELGQPSVKLYISDEKAAELKKATGNGFLREETSGVEHKPYDATGSFKLTTKQTVRRTEGTKPDRVNNQLSVRMTDLQLRKAA